VYRRHINFGPTDRRVWVVQRLPIGVGRAAEVREAAGGQVLAAGVALGAPGLGDVQKPAGAGPLVLVLGHRAVLRTRVGLALLAILCGGQRATRVLAGPRAESW
jgi:hypothetical protein